VKGCWLNLLLLSSCCLQDDENDHIARFVANLKQLEAEQKHFDEKNQSSDKINAMTKEQKKRESSCSPWPAIILPSLV
jgi:hypothetical protein